MPSSAWRSEEHTSELQSPCNLVCRLLLGDRKSTRLNSSHLVISYAVFCLKKKELRIQGIGLIGSVGMSSGCARAIGNQTGNIADASSIVISTAGPGLGLCVFFLMIRRAPRSPLFPYTTLFRSVFGVASGTAAGVVALSWIPLAAAAFVWGPLSFLLRMLASPFFLFFAWYYLG